MKIIGLTGGIASGKSTVSRWLKEEYHLPIIDADKLSREAVLPDSLGMLQIEAAFGSEFVLQDGNLNRVLMGECMSKNQKMRKRLNEIIHPLIEAMYEEKRERYRTMGEAIVVYDCPLLIEAEQYKKVDEVLLVIADEKERLKRIVERDGIEMELATTKMAIQMQDEEKIKFADTIIYNNGSIEDLHRSLGVYMSELKNKCVNR
ncbi:MAG: dephospho-CoA kinase [Eubacterium sp.]